jgi:hypothetical protein
MSRLYTSEEEIESVVRGFETCTTPAREFHHREHLTVAVWYLQTLSREEAVDRMREALFRFIDHHGVDPKKYSEEITVFWIREIASHLEGINADASLVEKCNKVIDLFNSPARKPAAPVANGE